MNTKQTLFHLLTLTMSSVPITRKFPSVPAIVNNAIKVKYGTEIFLYLVTNSYPEDNPELFSSCLIIPKSMLRFA